MARDTKPPSREERRRQKLQDEALRHATNEAADRAGVPVDAAEGPPRLSSPGICQVGTHGPSGAS